MPGKNGMGPEGKGPMTGRQMGNCNPGQKDSENKDSVYAFGKGNRSPGAGRGLGRRGNGLRDGSGQGRRGM